MRSWLEAFLAGVVVAVAIILLDLYMGYEYPITHSCFLNGILVHGNFTYVTIYNGNLHPEGFVCP